MTDERDELWAGTFRVYYDAFYEELLATKVMGRWQLLDEVTKVLVAITASSSAIAGWALWQQEQFKVFWTVIAGVGALLAIVHAVLAVPRRLTDWQETKNCFLQLRVDLETLRERMRLSATFDVNLQTVEFLSCRKRYADGMAKLPNDLLVTSRLEHRVQDELNSRLTDEIETNKGNST